MKTKVTFELIEDLSYNEIAIAMIKGETFYNEYGCVSYRWNGEMFINNYNCVNCVKGDFYRRVETPVEWWEDLDSLRFPIALLDKHEGEIISFTKREFDACSDPHNFRLATKAEIQVLLDNAPED